jgi:thiamine pyrophosphokinase
MNKIEFKGKYDAILCLNANLPEREFFGQFKDLPVIAADGAANRLLAKGIVPDYIIGDLDSITDEVREQVESKSEIILKPSQEKNDFQKILEFSASQQWTNLLICGIHGGQLEHTFNNWSVFIRFARQLNLCIYDENRYAIAIQDSASFEVSIDELISLIPQGKCKLSTQGLKWELNGEYLELGTREGARNRAVSGQIILDVSQGSVLVFLDAQVPNAPTYE